MSMLDLLRKKESPPESDSQFDKDGTFEHDIEAALDLDVEEQVPPADLGQELALTTDGGDDYSMTTIDARPEPLGEVLTPHAQELIAAFSVFESANNANRDELATIGKAFTSIVTNFNLGRDFVESCRQEILRASELEQANQRLMIENRRLLERVEKQNHSRERLDDMFESAKRREARLIQDGDTLRLNISDLRLELIEARNANVAAEHARADMHMALAGKTADAERLSREIDVLREKMAGMATELDASQKRQSDLRAKCEELHTLYSAETSRFAELSGRTSSSDKEILRLQKQCDAAEAQLKETSLALQNAEHDIWERDRRHQSELQSLKTETEQLSARLQRFSEADTTEQQEFVENDQVPVIPLRSRSRRQPQQSDVDPAVTAAE